ncbi:MAG: DUF418 domain-containing protein [Pseudomonadota bacterium]|nr:DUF418 domain-containing protein [Sphingomonas sp.]MDQ3479312.1 DUF418 domain-containing protein [Pseudomonadota bacterium]
MAHQKIDRLIGPVGAKQRIQELDVLRGIALFGVLVMNFMGFAGEGVLLTEAQMAAMPTASLDHGAYWGVRWLIGDKANTVFATLFGLGFYLQLQRGQGSPGFEVRYRRRLAWLLVFGLLNIVLLWPWDILHLYALAGFFLLATRGWTTRALVVFGVIAALYSDRLQRGLIDALALPVPTSDHMFTDAAIMARQTLLQTGDYAAIVVDFFPSFVIDDWVLNGALFAWIIYALGRFALGAAIGRSGILDDVPRFVPLLRRIAWIAIPVGLVLGWLVRMIYTGDWTPLGESEGLRTVGHGLRSPVALLLAAGYCAGVVVALQQPWGRRLFGVFAPVGRMALTNYLAQGLMIAFVLTGVGPGLALAGKIGAFTVLLASIAFFGLQILYSHWWLARFRFGPMEWVWRALTYSERPAFRLPTGSTATA